MRYLIGLIFFLSTLAAQVTDKNFKEKLYESLNLCGFPKKI